MKEMNIIFVRCNIITPKKCLNRHLSIILSTNLSKFVLGLAKSYKEDSKLFMHFWTPYE